MQRSEYLALAARGLRMPIGTHLVLHEQRDPEAIERDGRRLGAVVAEAARHYGTPLAMPLMDLTIEKAALLEMLGVAAVDIGTHHFTAWAGDGVFAQVADRMPAHRNVRLEATCAAVAHIARETDFVPVGMVIGPLSLLVKLIAEPITALFMAGRGRSAAESLPVLLVEKYLELGTRVILWSIDKQLAAGAKAVVVCEPAASTAYLSPRQLAAGSNLLARIVLEPNRRIRERIAAGGAELIFHCCGELTDDFVRAFVQLRPVILSLGSSRKLWEDAALVPDDVVMYGNLPTKSFYSDEACPLDTVIAQARNIIERMRATGHPFILGSECDVLSVPGAHETIRRKVEAMLRA